MPLIYSRIFIRTFLTIVILYASFSQVFSQEVEVKKIKEILFAEFQKASIQKYSENEIELLKLPPDKIIEFGLNQKSKESFYINSNGNNLTIASSSTTGLQNGVYWYLNFLGFRYYFPNSIWHYIPVLKSPFKTVNKVISPSFDYRRIWYAYGTGSKKADMDYQKWVSANLLGGVSVSAGHSYDGIVNRNKTEFEKHPEYFAGKINKGHLPKNPKFEVSNERLVQLVIKDAFSQIESIKQNTGSLPDMISLDPSDGGGYSTSPASLKIGNARDQVFYLANRVAKSVRKKYPSVQIGLYAYYLHASPPSFDLEPNIVVLVATAMNQSAYRTDELIALWKKKGVEVGVRDYYGVMAWDWDMPGQPAGSRLSYIDQLTTYHKEGIKLFTAETNTGWISRGLGHYIATKLLWDISSNTQKIKEEFFKNMFGNAASIMEELFMSWQQYNTPIPLEGDLYKWNALLDNAGKLEKDVQVQERIIQVKQYLHYVYLFKQWREQNSDDNLIELLSYAYRLQDDGIIASYPLFRRIADGAVANKPFMRFNDPNAIWKKNKKPISLSETNQNFYNDQNSLNQTQKTTVTLLPEKFSTKIISRDNFKSFENKTSLPVRLRGAHKVVFNLSGNSASLNISTGLIKAKQFKTLRLSIYPYNRDLVTIEGDALMNVMIEPKQAMKAISLSGLEPGTYIALIDDARNGFTLSFSGPVEYGFVADNQNNIWGFGRNNFVFGVNGVKEFVIKNEGHLTVISPTGRVIDYQKQNGTFTINVLKGEEGIWKVQNQSGKFYIQGVIPLVNPDLQYLLNN